MATGATVEERRSSDDLARFRLERAEEFGRTATLGAVVSDPVAYAQAVSIELSLKAFLLSRGWSDERTRVELRHDLARVLDAAEAAGLEPEANLRRLAEALNVFYAGHDWALFRGEPADVLVGGARVVAALLKQVRSHVTEGD
jgi:hypothetical protein